MTDMDFKLSASCSSSDSVLLARNSLRMPEYKRVPDKVIERMYRDLIKQKEVDTIVVGLPLNMDGTKGVRVEKTYAFCENLSQKTEVPIVYVDERLTTVSAQKLLISADVRREKRKTVVDKIAACIILQSYLDKKS